MNSLSHVAIIMDGNGRWAQKKNKPRSHGHYYGTKNIYKIVNFCLKKKISYLTLFAFGLDNWKRPKSETDYLFFLFQDFIEKNLNLLLKKDIKIKFIGELALLDKEFVKLIKKTEKLSFNKKKLSLIIALNYSSKHEILHSCNQLIIYKKEKKKIKLEELSNNLYTSIIPDPDILIRTGGLSRLSNFLLWQSSYSEIFFCKKLWPDFTPKDLSTIISRFRNIKRNFGSI